MIIDKINAERENNRKFFEKHCNEIIRRDFCLFLDFVSFLDSNFAVVHEIRSCDIF